MKRIAILIGLAFLSQGEALAQLPALRISSNNRFFEAANGKPFFWLGDTGWLLFIKTSREEAVQYLQARKEQGFNVVQAMLVHEWNNAANVYGQPSFDDKDLSKPHTTPGNDVNKPGEYDYWDHVDYIIDEAAKRGIYMALVPVWGSTVKSGTVTVQQATAYAGWLANRYRNRSNIIWLNGGDLLGTDSMAIWRAIGHTLMTQAPDQLVTFHPRGRFTSSEWFHNEPWLDFNMFQSGHKTYAQDTSSKEQRHYGEDNWRYIREDYAKHPAKPTLDGEPSYENIPYGLHDTTLPRWSAADLRRYAWWSVFAGGAGFTYGENSVMQFHNPGDADRNFGANKPWKEAIHAPGANQMRYLKHFMLKYTRQDREPAQEIVANNNGEKYDYILATKGRDYAMAYTYTGKPFTVDFSKLGFIVKKARWYRPQNGNSQKIRIGKQTGLVEFDPPGAEGNGNDWVLLLQK